MKYSFIIFCTVLMSFLTSCNTNNTDTLNVNQTAIADAASFLSEAQIVGIFNDKKEPTIVVQTSDLLSQWNTLVDINEPLTTLLIFSENDTYYLRASGQTYVSTVELSIGNTVKGHQVLYLTGNTICTSDGCSSAGGCLPQGAYCSDCNKGAKDCKRSTSSKTPFTPIALLDDYQYLQ